jgi:hypothetical protein
MIFTNEQLERFKYCGRRVLVEIEEWSKNPDVGAGKIAGELGAFFSEGYHAAMHEVQSSPWEYRCRLMTVDRDSADYKSHATALNVMADVGWEPFMTCGSWLLLRRRKAVAEIAAKEKPE